MAHRPATQRAVTKVMRPVVVKRPTGVKVSNWWYVVGFLGGMVVVAIWWLYLYNPIMSIFY